MDFTGARYRVEEIRTALGEFEEAGEAHGGGSRRGEPSEAVARVLARLEGVRASSGGWTALCPGHDDYSPSLSVAEGGDGRCLLRCFAGCTLEQVLDGLRLEHADLFPAGAQVRRSAQKRALDLVEAEGVELFHDPQERAYALVPIEGHIECWEVESGGFQRWLRHGLWRRYSTTIGREALTEALGVLAARAQFDGPQRAVHRRVGGDLERLLIDLGDETWRIVAVDDRGTVQVLERSPVPFVREPDMLALPVPDLGGSIDELRSLVNLSDEDTWTLTEGALLGMFHPSGPYFVTLLQGAPGSGKTALARYLARLVDPFSAQFLNGSPRNSDLMVAAANGWLVGIDNVSQIRRDTSDLLCVLSTGAGDRRRALYTNADAFTLEAKRPILITSVGRVAARPDLVDRCVPIQLEAISRQARRGEQELDLAFDAARARIFGGIVQALAGALRDLPETGLPELPRMADVTRFVTAAEPGLGVDQGRFLRALTAAHGDAIRQAVQGSPFIEAVLDMMGGAPAWEGTATDLWQQATKKRPEATVGSWPQSARAASIELDEHEIALREHGIEIERGRRPGNNRDRMIQLVNRSARDAGRAGTDGADSERGRAA